MALNLLTLPAEIRNRIYELIVPFLEERRPYTSFAAAFRNQPRLLQTCRQLQNELWPMYFSNIHMVVAVSTPEIHRFKRFVQMAGGIRLATLQRLSLSLLCPGHPEFSHMQRCLHPHHVLYELRMSASGLFEVEERHGFWHIEFGEPTFNGMNHTDSLGYSTCTHWGLLPVYTSVGKWAGAKTRIEELVALLDTLCGHELVAWRLSVPISSRQSASRG